MIVGTKLFILIIVLYAVCDARVKHEHHFNGGYNFIQFAGWRFGLYDDNHFVFSSNSGNTAVIYRGDGTVHEGPRQDFRLWDLGNSETRIKIGKNYIQFGGTWRLAQIDNAHLSLSRLGNTCMIWRADGTKHPGPRNDFNGFQTNNQHYAKIGLGQDFVQIGNWRIGAFNNQHFSIGTRTVVSDIYRNDGTIHPGPRFDFIIQKTFYRSLN